MATVKINQKKYEIPDLTFRHLPMMEKCGLSIMDLVSDKYIFTSAQVFTCIVVGCDTNYADHLLEQHILGGGEIGPIVSSFIEAVNNSPFFAKLLKQEKEKETEEKND